MIGVICSDAAKMIFDAKAKAKMRKQKFAKAKMRKLRKRKCENAKAEVKMTNHMTLFLQEVTNGINKHC